MPWNVRIRPGSPGFAPSLRRTRETQTRRYWRSSRYSGPQTLVRSSVWRTTLPAFAARCWRSSHSVRESWTSSPDAGDHAPLEVDLDVVEADHARAGLSAGGAADDGPHARGELVGVERLGDVVVRAEVEALRLVGGRALGGEQDHRHRAPLAQLPHHLDPVQVRHDDVQQDDVRADLLGLGQRVLAAVGGHDAEALLRERDADELRDARFVVCDEDERLGAHASHLPIGVSVRPGGCRREWVPVTTCPPVPHGRARRGRSAGGRRHRRNLDVDVDIRAGLGAGRRRTCPGPARRRSTRSRRRARG